MHLNNLVSSASGDCHGVWQIVHVKQEQNWSPNSFSCSVIVTCATVCVFEHYSRRFSILILRYGQVVYEVV